MYKLLIADDEAIERDALKFIITNSSLNIGEIKQAANGQEAISIATVFDPDIVILDIKMPGLNGIEAAKILKKINQQIKIIFLTAFDEFEYAHEAIKIGVEDFIIKPAPNERTLEVLSTVISQLDHEKQSHLQKKDMEQKLNQVSKYLEGEFLSSVVTGEIDEQQSKEYMAFMLSEFSRGFGVAIALDFNSDVSYLSKNMIKKRFIEKLSLLMSKNMKFLLNQVRNTIYILVFNYPQDQKGFYENMIDDEIKQIRDVIADQLQANVSMGVGEEYNLISELWKSFSQAKITAKNKLVTLLEDSDVNEAEVHVLELKEKELCDSIFNGNEAEMMHIVDDIIDNIIYQSSQMNDIRLKVYEFIVLLNRSLMHDRNLKNIVPDKFFNELLTVESKGDAKIYIHEFLLKIMEEKKQCKNDKTAVILDKTVKYIQKHYAENLTLEDVAFQSGFSTYYFCKMFKKYYSSSFTDYLSNIRIQHAKILLKDPKMNIKDITQMIGYVDPNYFTRVFKKVEGITPTEYRNKTILN